MPEIALPTLGLQQEIKSLVERIQFDVSEYYPISYQGAVTATASQLTTCYEIAGEGVIDSIYGFFDTNANDGAIEITIDGIKIYYINFVNVNKAVGLVNINIVSFVSTTSGLVPKPYNTGSLSYDTPVAHPNNGGNNIIFLSRPFHFQQKVEVKYKKGGGNFFLAVMGGIK